MKAVAAKIKMPKGVFLPFQKKWADDPSRLKLLEKSRQTGMTWTSAKRDTIETADADALNDVWVSSRDDLQARLYIEDCKYWAGVFKIVAEDMGLQIVDERKNSAYVLRFANGRQIHSLSSNADAQAGKRGTRRLDEFALHPDPRKLYSIAYPGITWGGSLEILSTHRGSANFFNALVVEAREKGNPKKFSPHRVTLQDALDQGFLAKLQSKLPAGSEILDMDEAAYFDFIKAGCADEESFQQEYMCVPADDAGAFLPFDLIDGCTLKGPHDLTVKNYGYTSLPAGARNLAGGIDPINLAGNFYLGIDMGRKRDLTVFWLIERTGGHLFTRGVVEMAKTEFSKQAGLLDEFMTMYPIRRVCIDATGMGMEFAENARKRYGEFRAEEVTFTPDVKEKLAFPVLKAFQDKSLSIPNDRQVIADLRKVRKETTAAGNIRFVADNDDGHADRFWALALAIEAAKSFAGPVHFQRIEKHANEQMGAHSGFGVGGNWGGGCL